MTEEVHETPIAPPRRRHAAGTAVALVLIVAGIAGAIVINHRRHKVAEGAQAIIQAGTRSADDIPILGKVEDFALTNQDGEPVTLASLLGRVWVADYFFTYCGTYCPKMNRNLSDLHREFVGAEEPKFVSITADPGRDKPAALVEHARILQADTKRWWFLTGEQKNLAQLAFSLGLPYEIGVPASHSTKFVLIDREGQIRGRYAGMEKDGVNELRRDLRALLNAPPKG